jgi:hypothetical protein
MTQKGTHGISRPGADDDLIQIVLEEHQKNAELALIHLRDARNILQGLEALPPNRALPKSVILLASAALESNLTYLAGIALRFMNARPDRFYHSPDKLCAKRRNHDR